MPQQTSGTIMDKATKTKLEAAAFRPGDYWTDGSESEWLRFQTIFAF